MTSLDSFLVHIFSLACFQGKSSSHFSSFVGPNTLLEWREFLSALKTIFLKFTSNARRSHFDSPCIEMLSKVVRGQKAMILFLCFEAEFQFKSHLYF